MMKFLDTYWVEELLSNEFKITEILKLILAHKHVQYQNIMNFLI